METANVKYISQLASSLEPMDIHNTISDSLPTVNTDKYPQRPYRRRQ